jgi:mono/diheme cytochrome c family protein
MQHSNPRKPPALRWLALFVVASVVLTACGQPQMSVGQVQQTTEAANSTSGEEEAAPTEEAEEEATPTAEEAEEEATPTAEEAEMAMPTPEQLATLPADVEVGPDDILITIMADEERDRWSAIIPEEYAGQSPPFPIDDPDAIAEGEALYIAQDCAVCHGIEADGNGPLSSGLNPRPIDFTNAPLMNRLGDDYLYWRLSEGGLQTPFLSAMPSFKNMLSDEERWQIIAYIRNIEKEEPPEDILVGGVDPQVGLNLLQTYGCFACHRYNEQGSFVGPDLHNIGAQRSHDQLLADIIDPTAELAEGFPDVMPRDYSEQMSQEDLELMVNFLAGSTGEQDIQAAMQEVEEEPTATEAAAEAEEEPTATEEATEEPTEAVAEEEPTEEAPETAEEEPTDAAAEAEPSGPELQGSDALPFSLDGLSTAMVNGQPAFLPVNPYNIFVNYELGMHCVGFNMTYCCMIPPYNSIQAQGIRSGTDEETRPKLLTPEDDVAMYYSTDNNTYSEGDKMVYWSVGKDVNGDGDMDDANDNFANYVWTHLYIYEDLHGTIPEGVTETMRLHVGKEIPVQVDHGPSGMPMEGFAHYSGEEGSNVVFTESRYGHMADIPLVLTASHLWDALGLPLTAFSDDVLAGGSHRTIDDPDFQPYQPSRITLYEVEDGEPTEPLMVNGEEVSFIGTNPLDMPACSWCHGSERANTFGDNDYSLYQSEYEYWMETYPDTSEYMARTKAGLISILEMHDDKHETDFLAEYNVMATKNRLGSQGPVNCSDCHGDNIQGRLKSTDETEEEPIMSLPEAMHGIHLSVVADPDGLGRTQSCQVCHPAHTSNPELNVAGEAFSTVDREGNPRYTGEDIRDSAGCYTSRDAHSNRDAEPPFFLNAVGEYLLENVSTVDGELKGLYCTNCHNLNSQALYKADTLETAQMPGEDETLRNKSMEEIAEAITGSDDVEAYANYYMDPKVGAEGNPLLAYYTEHEAAPLPEVGEGVTYADASAGEDWWLSAAEPHCADCHVAPFVESMGGAYFPIDQEGKYSLMRYSKAHANLACQSCHQSIHGLYSVYERGEETTDMTTHEQALQFSPDGEYTGPVTCVACHVVGPDGVPVELEGTDYYEDYWASVVLIHAMRDGDHELAVDELLDKHSYEDASTIVEDSMP